MTTQGVVLIDLMGLALVVLLINLVRTQKLYVGYAVIWLVAVAGMMLTISFAPLLRFVTRAVGALFPVSALSLLAFVFIFGTLIFFSVKLSVLSARQTELIQLIALKGLLEDTNDRTLRRDSADHPAN
jgi:hypothetical protein